MILSIHQPSYWPWLGLLDKIAKSDLLVLLDDVAANKEGYQYRNIFFCLGKSKSLPLPVDYKLSKKINELRLKNYFWINEHLEKIRNYYLKTPFFTEIFPLINNFYSNIPKYEYAVEVIERTMLLSFELFNIKVNTIKSSNIPHKGKKAELVLSICVSLKADAYLAGRASKDYMKEILPRFQESNISVLWHNFKHPKYPQHPKFKFVEGLSCLDILFFNGVEKSRQIFWDNVYSSQKNSNKKE